MNKINTLLKLIKANKNNIDDIITSCLINSLDKYVPIQQQDCFWAVEYNDHNNIICISKNNADRVIGCVQFTTNLRSFSNSNPDDEDLCKVMNIAVSYLRH